MSPASPSGFSIPHRSVEELARTPDEDDGIAADDRFSANVSFVFFAVLFIIIAVGSGIYYLVY